MSENLENKDDPAENRDEGVEKLLQLWNQRKGQVGLGLLMGYLALLALGTLGEVFEIESILNLPPFLPPGKF